MSALGCLSNSPPSWRASSNFPFVRAASSRSTSDRVDAAFGCGIVHGGHFVAVCVGIVFVLFGLYSQLVSGTTRDRWINVVGIGLAFLGMGLGLSHGGFTI